MKDKYKYNTSQLFNFAQDSYLERTSRPIYAIVFLLPFIVFYELGVIFIRTDVLSQSPVLVHTFVWLQKILEYLNFGGKLAWVAPPLVVVVILISLQLTSGKRWHLWFGDMLPMAVECILLAVPLIVLTLFLNSLPKAEVDIGRLDNNTIYAIHNTQFILRSSAAAENGYDDALPSLSSAVEKGLPAAIEAGNGEPVKQMLLANIVTGIGAGIYEELIFRLILICALMILFQDVLRLDHKNAIILSVLISAALFSAHHHIDFLSGQFNQRDPFSWIVFGFRTIAGVYFAVLFAIRGFAITAGTHCFYNIIAVSMNAVFSQQ